MKKRITQKVKNKIKHLIDNCKCGYWSDEVREYLEMFSYPSRLKLDSYAQAYWKGYRK